MNQAAQIQKTFNKAYLSYDTHGGLQATAGQSLLKLLSHHTLENPTIIDLGCGTGVTTEQLAKTFPFRELHAIDFADSLLNIAHQRLSPLGVKVMHGNFDQLSSLQISPHNNPPTNSHKFDIIFSNMALHWSVHFEETIQSLKSYLNQQGLLVFSIPTTGTLPELHPHFSVNKFMGTDYIANQLIKNNFEILSRHTENIILPFNNTLSALRSIKNVGANCTGQRPLKQLRSKSFINSANLQQLTYCISYFIARKPS